MKTAIAATITAALCVSCAAPKGPAIRWQKAGASSAELEAEKQACVSEATKERPEIQDERVGSRVLGNAFVDCMKQRGWSRVSSPEE